MPAILDEQEQWVDSAGKPLVGGKVYYGVQNADPVLNPQAIFADRDFTTPIDNPQILDANGRTTDKVWIKDRYSIKVTDLNNVQQYQELDNGEPGSVGLVTLDNVIGANDISATGTPTVTSYVDKETYVFKTVSINTGAVTLNIDGVGPAPVIYSNGGALIAEQWKANQNVKVIYNETSASFVFEQYREMTQAEAEAGTSTVPVVTSALRQAEAIAALVPPVIFPVNINVGTAQATTSGTEFDFTGLPVEIKRITIMFDGVSLSGTNDLLVQIGDAGGFEVTGYDSGSRISATIATDTTGFVILAGVAAAGVSGQMVLTRIQDNDWVASHACFHGTLSAVVGGGDKSLSGELTQLRITRDGADTFDAGAVNIFFEI